MQRRTDTIAVLPNLWPECPALIWVLAGDNEEICQCPEEAWQRTDSRSGERKLPRTEESSSVPRDTYSSHPSFRRTDEQLQRYFQHRLLYPAMPTNLILSLSFHSGVTSASFPVLNIHLYNEKHWKMGSTVQPILLKYNSQKARVLGRALKNIPRRPLPLFFKPLISKKSTLHNISWLHWLYK